MRSMPFTMRSRSFRIDASAAPMSMPSDAQSLNTVSRIELPGARVDQQPRRLEGEVLELRALARRPSVGTTADRYFTP